MTASHQIDVEAMIADAARRLPLEECQRHYSDQDEFLVMDEFLTPDIMRQWDVELEALKPHIHRSYIPKHKKGGSVGYDTVKALAPTINRVYHSRALQDLLSRLVQGPLQECPASDLHRCALYAYTEEGDHIGWHYDTSYYKDRRWTLLAGFQDQSSSRLQCRLHTRNPARAEENLELQVGRGTLVLFNGDKLYHAVTPLKAGEHRFIITMQYVASVAMNPFLRFVSNMKDSIAYFGLREVFFGRGRSQGGTDA